MPGKEKSANLIRLIDTLIALAAAALYAKSCAEQMQSDSDEYLNTYFIAMVIASIAGLLNTLARMLDHWGNPKKIKNQIAGGISIVLSLIQIILGIGTTYSWFPMPSIAIPPLLNALGSVTAGLLNCEPGEPKEPEGPKELDQPEKSENLEEPTQTCKDSCRANAERYVAFSFVTLSLAFSIWAWKTASIVAYFLASTFYDANILADWSNRKRDIDSDPATNKPFNKRMIRWFGRVMFPTFATNLIVSGLNGFRNKNIGFPIAFPNCMLEFDLPFYLLAQTDFSVVSKMYSRAHLSEQQQLIVPTSETSTESKVTYSDPLAEKRVTISESTHDRDKTSVTAMIDAGGRWNSPIAAGDVTAKSATLLTREPASNRNTCLIM